MEIKTSKDKLHLKANIIAELSQSIERKIKVLKEAIAHIEESRNNETKSSAGDKFETGRQMMQMEADKFQQQLDLSTYSLQQIKRIPKEELFDITQAGSIILTDKLNYFISVPAGKLTIDEIPFYAISIDAPICSQLLRKQKGDSIQFNQQIFSILDTF